MTIPKYFISLLFVLFLGSNLNLSAQSVDPAVAYLNEILGPLQETKDETWKYLRAATRGKSAKTVENKRLQLIAELRSVKSQIRRKGGYEGDLTLKENVLNYLELSAIVLDEDFGKILDMEEIAEQSYDLMEAYLLAKEKASEKIDSAFQLLSEAEKDFAEKNDITLLEGEQDKKSAKIQQAGELLGYYNQIYLIFFKAYKQEFYIIDAMDKSDLASFQQNMNALQSIVEEGLQKTDSLPSFKNDLSLKTATNRILKFYGRAAEVEYPKVVDFMIKKEHFEKVQKSFESKSKREQTEEDIEEFNQAVESYNEAMEKANETLKTLNKTRESKLNEFNKSVESFFNKGS